MPQQNAAAKTRASLLKKQFANAFPEVLDNNRKQKSEVNCELFHSKNENSVIIYTPSCHSKPIRFFFIFGTQMKIFVIYYIFIYFYIFVNALKVSIFKLQKLHKNIVKIIHKNQAV